MDNGDGALTLNETGDEEGKILDDEELDHATRGADRSGEDVGITRCGCRKEVSCGASRELEGEEEEAGKAVDPLGDLIDIMDVGRDSGSSADTDTERVIGLNDDSG